MSNEEPVPQAVPPANDAGAVPAREESARETPTSAGEELLASLLSRAMSAEQRLAEIEAERRGSFGAAGGQARVLAAEARVAEAEADAAQLKDQALRAMAEAENTRRRLGRELEEGLKFAVAGFAREVVAVGDNLRRALDTLTAEARAADPKLEQFAQGVELTEREFLVVLERHGIQRVAAAGQPFDPAVHQAIAQLDSAEHPPGTVIQVVQAGFTLHGRILRPALVVVAKAPSAGPPPGAVVDTVA